MTATIQALSRAASFLWRAISINFPVIPWDDEYL